MTSLEYVKRVVAPRGRRLWIGATDRGHEGYMTWAESGHHVAVSDWFKNQPDNYGGEEHCVEMNGAEYNNQWNDVPCYTKMAYICQRTGASCPRGWN